MLRALSHKESGCDDEWGAGCGAGRVLPPVDSGSRHFAGFEILPSCWLMCETVREGEREGGGGKEMASNKMKNISTLAKSAQGYQFPKAHKNTQLHMCVSRCVFVCVCVRSQIQLESQSQQ